MRLIFSWSSYTLSSRKWKEKKKMTLQGHSIQGFVLIKNMHTLRSLLHLFKWFYDSISLLSRIWGKVPKFCQKNDVFGYFCLIFTCQPHFLDNSCCKQYSSPKNWYMCAILGYYINHMSTFIKILRLIKWIWKMCFLQDTVISLKSLISVWRWLCFW